MDTSLSKALIMVASVLLAMLVIAFIAHSFMQIGGWATTEDDEVLLAQKEKFNKEYEAYDKDLMYGVDVISCLNKAKSNNDKIEGKYSERVDEGYHVDVNIELKKTLQECIIVYKSNGKTKEVEATSDWNSNYKISDTGFKFFEEEGASGFKGTDTLKTAYKDSDMTAGKYSLTYTNTGENEEILRAKLGISNDISEIVKNKSLDNVKKASDGYFWTKAEFRSALYDLKTRKFTCTSVEYNPETGRISSISFKELR